EYLEETHPSPPILPRDPYLRARTRMLAQMINSGIQPFQNLETRNRVKELGGDPKAWSASWIQAGLAAGGQGIGASTGGGWGGRTSDDGRRVPGAAARDGAPVQGGSRAHAHAPPHRRRLRRAPRVRRRPRR